MKQTDFDFIRDKFSSDGVHAPDELNEELISRQLAGVQPLQEKKNHKKLIGAASVAASVAVITAGAFITANIFGALPWQKKPLPEPLTGTASLRAFQNKGEIRDVIKRTMDFRRNLYSNDQSSAAADIALEYGAADEKGALNGAAADGMTGAAASGSSHNATYVQHTGVDEADCLKTDGKYLYYLSENGNILIYSAKGEQSEKVAVVKPDSEDAYFNNFYVRSDRLIVLSQKYYYNGEPNSENYSQKEFSKAEIYDISDVSHVTRVDEFAQGGSYCSSRMIGDTLYLVSTDYANDENSVPVTCSHFDNGKRATFDEVPAQNVYTVDNPTSANFLVVSRFDTKNSGKDTVTKAILGSAQDVYCTQEHLYVTAMEYSPVLFEDVLNNTRSWSWNYLRRGESTQIVKVDLLDNLNFTASAAVRGEINNQYSLDEYEGNLRVATTSCDEDGDEINNLYVLSDKLEQLGEVTGFAKNESIKAVRYINETAYVITYERTDPLFVIDLSVPTAPHITGEVKITGFSSMLVPVDGNTLLGLGYETVESDSGMEMQTGLKIVTFDVTDKSNPAILDTKVFEDYTSDVQYDPKALLVNFDRGDYTIPYTSYIQQFDSETDRYGDPIVSGGTINFKIENGKIVVVDEYISDKLTSVRRCCYVDDTVYLFGDHYRNGSTIDNGAIDCVTYK